VFSGKNTLFIFKHFKEIQNCFAPPRAPLYKRYSADILDRKKEKKKTAAKIKGRSENGKALSNTKGFI